MNIFVTDVNPHISAQTLCDKHVPKMAVETTQMLVSAMRRHGATDDCVPLTKSGTPHKGGYANHPCTIWAGETSANFNWLLQHGFGLVDEYRHRYNKEHACEDQLWDISNTNRRNKFIPSGPLTDIALAVGDFRPDDITHAPIADAIFVYRAFYRWDKSAFAKWDKDPSRKPIWW